MDTGMDGRGKSAVAVGMARMENAAPESALSRHLPSIAIVVALHLAIGYALVTGLARRVVEVIKAPIETKIIEEIKKPPPDEPPPPPPKLQAPPPPFIPPPEINIQMPVQVAPTITTVTTTPPPPGPPPAVLTQVAPQPVVRRDYKASYRVQPTFPRRALSQGIAGRVVAWVHVTPTGSVTEVEIRRTYAMAIQSGAGRLHRRIRDRL